MILTKIRCPNKHILKQNNYEDIALGFARCPDLLMTFPYDKWKKNIEPTSLLVSCDLDKFGASDQYYTHYFALFSIFHGKRCGFCS